MKISNLYGMISKDVSTTETVRCVFIIDDKQILRTMLYYPMTTGRNIPEIIRIIDFKKGIGDEANIEYKKIMYELTKLNAKKFIILHNHPNGNDRPSKEDIEFTKKIKECSDMLGIKFVDHIIIAKGKYRSLV